MTVTDAIPCAFVLMVTCFGVCVLLPDVLAWAVAALSGYNDDE